MNTQPATEPSANWRVMIDHDAAIISPVMGRNRTPHCGAAPAGDTFADLLARLLDDHQRVEPHHAHHCALCMAATSGIAALLDMEFTEAVTQ